MSRGQRRVAILIAIVGTIASVLALSGFILRVHGNRLDLPPVATVYNESLFWTGSRFARQVPPIRILT